jgi:hypothetical protein
VFPFGVWWNEYLAVIYSLSDLGLEGVVAWKSRASINSVTLDSYCFVGIITKVFPLSARVIMASLSLSFAVMFLIVFFPSAYCVCRGLLFFFRVFMLFVVHFLQTSRSEGGEGGGMIWRFLLPLLGFVSGFWALCVSYIWGLSVVGTFLVQRMQCLFCWRPWGRSRGLVGGFLPVVGLGGWVFLSMDWYFARISEGFLQLCGICVASRIKRHITKHVRWWHLNTNTRLHNCIILLQHSFKIKLDDGQW